MLSRNRNWFWRLEVSAIGGVSVKGGVGSFCVVEGQIFGQIGARIGDVGVGPQVDFFIFDRLPEPLDKDIIAPILVFGCAFAVHGDFDVVLVQDRDEGITGELAALVGVEYLRRAVFGDGLLQCSDAKIVRHRP